MLAMIFGFVQSVVSGVVGPVFTYLGKAKDDTLMGFQTGAQMDAASYAAYLQAYVQVQQLKASQNSAPMARAIGGAAGALSVFYYGAIVLDSVFHFGWKIDKLGSSGQWDTAAWVIIQSFIIVAPVLPMTTAVSAWLHRK
jgi:hypothetical protein